MGLSESTQSNRNGTITTTTTKRWGPFYKKNTKTTRTTHSPTYSNRVNGFSSSSSSYGNTPIIEL